MEAETLKRNPRKETLAAAAMANYDLTSRIAPHLDRHLVFPLLEFLQERQLYDDDEILKAKIELLSQTNMVDYAMDIHKSLYHTDDVPQEMIERRVEVVARLKSLEESAAPLISFLQSATLVQELRADKQYNIQMLHDRFQNFASPLNQLQNRIWLMHWSLFIFFNHENGRNGIIDLFFQDRYLNAIQTNAHHLLRYVATAVIVNKRRRNMLKELIKVIQQEQHCYKDPVTEFLECLYINYDFEGAQKKLKECEQKLNMNYDEAEMWIMNLVRSSKLEAKIDSDSGTLIMGTNHLNVHEQIIESLKNLNMRTYMLAKNIVEPAQATQTAR
ncbi:Eukaryotic translation initiation factor 3 subunit E [Ananas comosus]|uniref:Eukaryotic translation initiation factor 3 subunit E n=1 Tax=Ananas comosus TaxID=4615 RepID=A0A199VCE0_ANACO|nr:Eukaryotic translation initiation factor 3 subunit E [Ananas comosus]